MHTDHTAPFREPKRARRIRERERMIAKGTRVAALRWGCDRPNPFTDYAWRDRSGQTRHGTATWGDVFEMRLLQGTASHDHLAACSCAMCGNPRKWFKQPTIQEAKAADAASEQIAELTGEARRRRGRPGYW